MMKTWVKAGLGCMLLWTSASAGGSEEQLPAERGDQTDQRRCDRVGIEQLETEARELVVAEGCTDVSQCRAAPLGAMACGGPRDYVVYCSATTDENALLGALNRLEKRETRFNRQCGVVSICIFIAEPQIELVDGVCQAVTPPPEPLP